MKYLTTLDSIDIELERLGFNPTGDYGYGYYIRSNGTFRSYVIHKETYILVRFAPEINFDRWANSSEFELMLPTDKMYDLEAKLAKIEQIYKSRKYTKFCYFPTMDL